jgi:hypothetical protein
MQAESLEVLEKADVAPAQARAFVRAIEIEIAGAKDTLATKQDLLLLRQDLRAEIQEVRAEIQDLRAEMRAEIQDLRAEMRAEISELRLEFRGDLVKLEARLEGKIHESASSITRQMYMAVLGQMAVLLGFAYFFATHVR